MSEVIARATALINAAPRPARRRPRGLIVFYAATFALAAFAGWAAVEILFP